METPEVRRYVWYTTKISVCLYTVVYFTESFQNLIRVNNFY